VLAKAYPNRANQAYPRQRGIPATIPVEREQQQHRRKQGSAGVRPGPLPAAARRRVRHQPARAARGFATRDDELAVRYEVTVQIIDIWLRNS
jgi:hypothetical protein